MHFASVIAMEFSACVLYGRAKPSRLNSRTSIGPQIDEDARFRRLRMVVYVEK